MRSHPLVLGALALMTACACGTTHGSADGGLDAGVTAADTGVDGATAGEDADVDAGEAEASFLELCVRHRVAVCEGNVSCCSIDERRFVRCDLAPIESACRDLAADPALSDGTLTWRAADAEEFVHRVELRRLECDERDRSASLEDFLRGTLGAGETCTPFGGDAPLGRLRCQEGLRCELTGDNLDYAGVCAPPGVGGDSCMDDCASGFWCNRRLRVLSDPPFEGRCEARPNRGEACVADKACESVLCEESVCVDATASDSWCSQQD